MFFWIFVALLILGSMFLLFSSFREERKEVTSFDGFDADLQIYRMQLKEIDRDCANGFIDKASAEEAKLEIARAILKIEKAHHKKTKQQRLSVGNRIFLSIMILLVPVIAVSTYVLHGSPGLASHPFSLLMEKAPDTLTPAENLARLEVLALRNPSDSTIADQLSLAYLMANRFTEAANRYQDAIRLGGENAKRLTGYGMALVGSEGGMVTKNAQQLFEKAVVLDPDQYFAQVYLATASIQDGKPAAALERLEALYKRLPVQSPVRERLKGQIAELNAEIHGDKREALLNELHKRLNDDPDRLDGWQLLVKGWLSAGKKDEAIKALKDGIQKLPLQKAEKLKEFARDYGLNWAEGNADHD